MKQKLKNYGSNGRKWHDEQICSTPCGDEHVLVFACPSVCSADHSYSQPYLVSSSSSSPSLFPMSEFMLIIATKTDVKC